MKRPAFAVVVALLAFGCGDDNGELGAPCFEDSDCGGELVCDIHDESGSCQNAHDH